MPTINDQSGHARNSEAGVVRGLDASPDAGSEVEACGRSHRSRGWCRRGKAASGAWHSMGRSWEATERWWMEYEHERLCRAVGTRCSRQVVVLRLDF